MPRPSLLTPEIVAAARKLIATALFSDTVAACLGVSRSAFYVWLRRGAKELRRLESPKAKPKESEVIYVEFVNSIKRGRSEGEYRDLETIQAASAAAWQAAAWRLERRFPHRWGSQTGEIRRIARELEELKQAKHVTGGQPAQVEKVESGQ
jgi:transposase